MEKNVQTIPAIDLRFSSAEASVNGPAAKELTAQENASESLGEPKFFVRSDAASHSQFDR
jgi:hypothetical protein